MLDVFIEAAALDAFAICFSIVAIGGVFVVAACASELYDYFRRRF